MVTYTYIVQTLEGRIIYTEDDLKLQTYYMDQQELFTGLREGLKLMKEGESVFGSTTPWTTYCNTKASEGEPEQTETSQSHTCKR